MSQDYNIIGKTIEDLNKGEKEFFLGGLERGIHWAETVSESGTPNILVSYDRLTECFTYYDKNEYDKEECEELYKDYIHLVNKETITAIIPAPVHTKPFFKVGDMVRLKKEVLEITDRSIHDEIKDSIKNEKEHEIVGLDFDEINTDYCLSSIGNQFSINEKYLYASPSTTKEVREVTMEEVCKEFGEDVKIKK